MIEGSKQSKKTKKLDLTTVTKDSPLLQTRRVRIRISVR